MTRRRAAVAAAGALLALLPISTSVYATPPPEVSAKGAFLLDADSGAGLFGKAADTRRQMASTTKIMTVALVLDTPGIDLERPIAVQQSYRDYVESNHASSADLQTGDQLTVRQLLYATLLPSGCDAALALADTFGRGATEAERSASFIDMMNRKASALGLANTRFDSFDGISSHGETVTTPRDLAELARYALTFPAFREVVNTPKAIEIAIAANGNSRTYTWTNSNLMLAAYDGTIGVKTGTNTPAGPCLVFAATRGSRTVVGVVLNDSERYLDAGRLLDYAFNSRTAESKQFLDRIRSDAAR
ncbi:D-alanyl-D-alanine carboxypeptidase family protein [Streptomyces sp. NPDC059918]|uniref:D-alanyl-D-alanine carboxypeptidase family protein n=1 Tax=unclassified Streptomyces TaxID=2593676 RepID=UPI003659DEE4